MRKWIVVVVAGWMVAGTCYAGEATADSAGVVVQLNGLTILMDENTGASVN